jgi:pectate lyase
MKSSGSRRSLLLGAFAVFAATAAHALPVIPGAAGYGMSTPAGRGGAVYRVTNLNASGAGSLQACVDATGPRTCIFDVSGAIVLTSDLPVRNGNLTIAGQTAPSPGITIRGAALKIHGSDVLVQHLRIRVGDDPNGPDPMNRDALKIEGAADRTVQNVVIDHCSFSWSIDEVASVWGPHDNITFSNNIFAEPLNESLHIEDDGTPTLIPHGYGVLLGSSATGGRVTMTGNLFAHIVERNPLSRARELVFVNNVVYDRRNMDLDLQSQDGRVTQSSVVGNHFIRGASYVRTNKPINVRTDGTYTLYAGSRVYLDNNYAPDTGNSLAQILGFTGGDIIPGLMTTSAPVWNTGLPVASTTNNIVYNNVLRLAGARPTDRDSVDIRMVSDVRNLTGQIINCVSPDGSVRCSSNAGGWPTYAQNRRALPLPANPSTITASGYSNLELWLQQLDAQISGVAPAPSAPVMSVQ